MTEQAKLEHEYVRTDNESSAVFWLKFGNFFYKRESAVTVIFSEIKMEKDYNIMEW